MCICEGLRATGGHLLLEDFDLRQEDAGWAETSSLLYIFIYSIRVK